MIHWLANISSPYWVQWLHYGPVDTVNVTSTDYQPLQWWDWISKPPRMAKKMLAVPHGLLDPKSRAVQNMEGWCIRKYLREASYCLLCMYILSDLQAVNNFYPLFNNLDNVDARTDCEYIQIFDYSFVVKKWKSVKAFLHCIVRDPILFL